MNDLDLLGIAVLVCVGTLPLAAKRLLSPRLAEGAFGAASILLPVFAMTVFVRNPEQAAELSLAAIVGVGLQIFLYVRFSMRNPVRPEDSAQERAQSRVRLRWLTVTSLLAVLLWFSLLYSAGSQCEPGLLSFTVAGESARCPAETAGDFTNPLRVPDAIYLALGTYVTAGASGITASNPLARYVLLVETALVLVAVVRVARP